MNVWSLSCELLFAMFAMKCEAEKTKNSKCETDQEFNLASPLACLASPLACLASVHIFEYL